MNIWKLIAHHEQFEEAAIEMRRRHLIAIGWSNTGDLRDHAPAGPSDIGDLIKAHHPDANNAAQGGPSLWNLYREMDLGDLVIVAAGGQRRFVMEVAGDYFHAMEADGVLGYRHQRVATLTSLDAERLWQDVGAQVAEGQNHMWTLARCTLRESSHTAELFEGRRFDVRASGMERNPQARALCIQRHGAVCFVCDFDFGRTYGPHGQGYIHVHHRRPLADAGGVRKVDPAEDLVPLCPNCHAMVHHHGRLISPEALRDLLARVKGGEHDAIPV